MASPSTPGAPLSREVIQLHARRLQDRVLKGESPYPDAILEANDAFLRNLDASPGASVEDLVAKHEKQMRRADAMNGVFGGIGLMCGAATLMWATFGIPGPLGAVVGFCGAVAARAALRLAGRAAEDSTRQKQFVQHLQSWQQHDSEQPPKVAAWQGALNAKGLRTLAKDFPAELAGFPYAKEVERDHGRLMAALDKAGDRPVADVKAELIQQKPGKPVLSWVGRVVANVAFVAGTAVLGFGQHPWVGAGLLGASAAGYGLRWLAERFQPEDGAREARSLHYWQEAMAAVPPVTANDLIFGPQEGAKEPERVIESSTEDVLIGGVRVPKKGVPAS